MGRLLGAYDSDELDRPDLNKCPECGCYFATDECPLCGKLCPEEMRAGNRAAVKKPKRKKNGNYTGRVQFIPWYYSWWFILIMMFVASPVGIILFLTGPYSKKWKIIITCAALVWMAFSYTGVGTYLVNEIFFSEHPVNDDLSRAAYAERCESMTAEEFFRRSTAEGMYVTMELTVKERVIDPYATDEDYNVYYVCTNADGTVELFIRDCNLEGKVNYLPGDMIRVWGESAGEVSVYPDYERVLTHPCLHMAYCDLIG